MVRLAEARYCYRNDIALGRCVVGHDVDLAKDVYWSNAARGPPMSIPVPLDGLRAALAERGGYAYLLTVADDARPHAVHTPVGWAGDVLVADVGKRTAANAAARPSVSLLYPVRVEGDYSLIVDGIATVAAHEDGQRLLITPTKAVLHRPAVAPDPASACGADCVPLLPASTSRGGR